MRDIVHSYVRKFREERRERRKFLGVLLLLALAVGGGIMWQFKTTGIAYTNEAQCGIEEHTHSNECYAYVLTEDGSSQKTAAEEASEVLSAVVEEVAAIESEAAETQDAAAETADETSQAAGSSESEEAAVESETAAVESTGSTDAAISEEALPAQVLLTEAAETEDWYLSHGYEKALVCGKEEHTHTIECLSDETADLETAEVWEATLPSLTGVWADDVVAIAESQIGYAESILNFTFAEDSATRKGYTRYGAWYGNAYGDWDAMFAAFCLHYAGVSESDFPVNSGAYAWSVSLRGAGLYQTADSCTPAAGDLAFLDKDQDGAVDTVAVITNVNDTTLTVVEGNSNDTVEENGYEIGDGIVTGFGVLPEQDAKTLADAVKTYTASTEDGSVTVTVTAPYGALRDNVELVVTLLDEDSDAYAEAAEAVGYDAEDEDTGMAALDIAFYMDGVEVEPTEAVTVSINASALLPEEADASTIEVQHLAETDAGVEPVLVADASEETEGTVDAETVVAEFEVESFSSFTITWKYGNKDFDSASITLNVYDTATGELISSSVDSISTTSFTATSGLSISTLTDTLTVSGYDYSYATVTYSNNNSSGTVGSESNPVTSISKANGYGGSYTITYGSSTQPANSITSINLYYTASGPSVSISATKTDNGYTLTATPSNFSGTPTYSWSVGDEDKATLSYDSEGNPVLTWTEEAEDGDTVTVTVKATYTYTDSDGNEATEEAESTYTLSYGTVTVTIHTTYGTNGTSTGEGAYVALLDSDGNIVAYGTTDANGNITFSVPAGTYTVEATYSVTTTSSWQSSTTVYGATGTTVEVSGTTTQTVNLTSQDKYDHIDIRVSGTYTLNIDGKEYDLSTYVYGDEYPITVVMPDGTVIGDDEEADYSSSNSEVEYRYTGLTISGQWDSDPSGFTLSGSILISVSEVAASGLSASEIESLFGSYDTITLSSDTNGIPAGTYYVIPFEDYHPSKNVCDGNVSQSRGYDFEIDISELLMSLSDKLMVYKYVIDEEGNIISSSSDNTDFKFTLYTNSGSEVDSTTLQSEGVYTFEDIEAGYYYVEETAVSGYVPVSVSYDGNGNIKLSETGYIQYVQTETKEDGTVASVTYYNLKLENLGVVKLQKSVNESSANGTYSSDTFTFELFTENNDGSYTASSLNDITVTTSESKEFYLAAGTYTIVELGSDLTDGDSQTVSINGTTLTRTVAGNADPYGLEEGTVYFVGTIAVTSGTSLTYTATNNYTSSVNITIKKVDYDDPSSSLEGATFTFNGNTYTTDEDGQISIEGLSNGTYSLIETEAPNGYNLLTDSITITVSDGNVDVSYSGNTDSVTYVSYDTNTMTITIKNQAGRELPSTGGIGTYLYTLAGLLLILSAFCLMYKNLRRKGDLPY